VSARRTAAAAAMLLATVVILGSVLAAAAWNAMAARGTGWSHQVRMQLAGHTIEREVDMAVLLRTLSHPLAAPLLRGRQIDTAQGRWQLLVLPDGAVHADCAPCRLSIPALGPAPLVVERAQLAWRAEGADVYRGTLTLGETRRVRLEGRARFDRHGVLTLDARLPATPLADVVHVLGRDLPERDSVRVRGKLALALHTQLPRGAWRVEPQLDGFEVDGLGTERFVDLQRPAACRADAQAGVPSVGGWLPRAVVAAEDARFFEHPGYDLRALTDALQHNQRPGAAVAGASTLTQQLAKLLVAGDERSASRKLRELLYAVEMERTLGKARILQTYLALAPWGEGVCGAERAVRVHLGQRDASAIGPVAASWLASLLTAPDAHLGAERAAGAIDHARVARVLEALRPMRAERREKAQLQLLFWSPPGLAPPQDAATATATATPEVTVGDSASTLESPPVAPPP
jgi:hypothetical protein